MTRLVPSLALLALCAVSTASCSMLEDTQSAQSTPAASVSAGDPGQPSSSAMPTLHAASPGCATMDEIFTEALNGSETGQSYKLLAAKRSGETNADERHHAWEAFAASFKNEYSDRLTRQPRTRPPSRPSLPSRSTSSATRPSTPARSPSSPISREPRRPLSAVRTPR